MKLFDALIDEIVFENIPEFKNLLKSAIVN